MAITSSRTTAKPRTDAAGSQVATGLWQSGLNNVAPNKADLFRLNPGEAALRQAVNVDVTREGFLRRRQGYTLRHAMTNGHSLAGFGSFALCVDDGELLRLTLDGDVVSAEVLVNNISNEPMSYALAGDTVWCCNGLDAVRVKPRGGLPWSMSTPSAPMLEASTSGALLPGTYRVSLTNVAADSTEYGASIPEPIVLDAAGGILVSPTAADINAVYLRAYVTDLNGADLFFSMQVPADTESFLIASQAQATAPLRTIGMLPVPDGAHLVRAFKGRLLVAVGSTLYWSEALAYHLFALDVSAQPFASRIVMLEPMDDGFYLSEGGRTWWVSGDDPATWGVRQIDTRMPFEGAALRVPASKLPAVQGQGMVCVWATKDGPIAGLNGGTILPLSEKRIAIDPHQRASFGYREQNGLAQFLVSLEKRESGNAFRAYDSATCTVTKAS